MMINIRILAALNISMWIGMNVLFSQSVDGLIQEAVKNNFSLKALDKAHQIALERAPQVNQLPNPEIGIGAFPLPVETRLGAQGARLSAGQMFPWFGTLAQKQQLELSKAGVVLEKKSARLMELIFQIKLTYLDLYELRESQEIIGRNLQILESLEKLALSRVENGSATAADVLRTQLKIAELKQEINLLQQSLRQPTAKMNQILGRSVQTTINIQDSLSLATLPVNRDSMLTFIRNHHPALRVFDQQQEVSRQAISLNTLSGKPSFGVGVDYIMVNPRNDATPTYNGRDILQVKASVSIPLYRKKYQAIETAEKLKIEALSLQQGEVWLQYQSAIESAYGMYENAKLKWDLYQNQIKLTQAAINILQTAYSAEGRRFDELLNLQKDLIDYDMKMLKAIVQSHRARVHIERFIPQNQ